ncbi:response regulator transcription factor [Sulfurimonas sp. SAG-AH-194-I05]|nr:response regulator transcription factor [Sulfurimonas sp. SAG-AH-194-I05]MDF1875962.1 response regulator transcription factor [Sulfurimonas sp. SAG-AH-194-I05]
MNILLIDDDVNITKAIKQGLIEEGFRVDIAISIQEAKEKLDMTEYSLIILDKMLPDGDGSSFCLELRKDNVDTPVLMLSACIELDDIVGGLNNGADDYLGKPFRFRELVARIRTLSKRKSNIANHILKVQDITLNIMSREVTRSSQVIELRNNEFNILLLLIKRKNNVVSKTEIIDYVWNIDTFVDPNILNVTIYNLRKKLEYAGQEKVIKTVRGIGYKIVD